LLSHKFLAGLGTEKAPCVSVRARPGFGGPVQISPRVATLIASRLSGVTQNAFAERRPEVELRLRQIDDRRPEPTSGLVDRVKQRLKARMVLARAKAISWTV
jgi:hypothetical protein